MIKIFQIFGEEFFCFGDKILSIQYENGGGREKNASWIAQNIARCINKRVVYLSKS